MSHRRLVSLALVALTIPALAVVPNTIAPDFKGTDSNGLEHSLSQYRGKYVVLEWANKGCPYDQKHYLSGNMANLQKEWTAKGVVWLSVISSAPGEQGYVTPAEENEYIKSMRVASTATFLISLIPLITAENSIKLACVICAIIFASVVFPVPGGPQKIIEVGSSPSIASRNGFPGPSRCSCPTYSSSVRGRILSASGAPRGDRPGALTGDVSNKLIVPSFHSVVLF